MSHDLGLEVKYRRVDTVRNVEKQSEMNRMYFIHNSIHSIFQPVKVVTGPTFVEETVKKIFSVCVFGCVLILPSIVISFHQSRFCLVQFVRSRVQFGSIRFGCTFKKKYQNSKENCRCFFLLLTVLLRIEKHRDEKP